MANENEIPEAISASATATSMALTGREPARLPQGFGQALEQVMAGLLSLPDSWSMTVHNGTYTKAVMVNQVQTWLDGYGRVAALVQELQQERLALRAQMPEALQYFAEIKGVITGYFHAGSPLLTSFGFKPKKARAPLPAAKKAEAVVRAGETRKMRGTLGPKEKLRLKYEGPVTPAAVVSAPDEVSTVAAVGPVKPSG
jgi:hypothetical protein